MMSTFVLFAQSIQLEREPFESEVRVEVKRREEESRQASKKLQRGAGYMDVDFVDRLTELEARSNPFPQRGSSPVEHGSTCTTGEVHVRNAVYVSRQGSPEIAIWNVGGMHHSVVKAMYSERD